MKEPKFEWNEETKQAKCIVYYKNKEFVGKASCHIDDMDMASEKTGCVIALTRATIKYLQFIKENELKPQLQALYELKNNMKYSSKLNTKSYEYNSLQRITKRKENELEDIKIAIEDCKNSLAKLIKEKDEFYQKIRANRKKEAKRIKEIDNKPQN